MELTWREVLKQWEDGDGPILLKVRELNGKIPGIKRGDVIELTRVEKYHITLDLANQRDSNVYLSNPKDYPLNDSLRFKVAMRQPREHIYESVQELIDDYPAVTKLVAPQQEFMHGNEKINVNEKLEIRGKSTNSKGEEFLEVFSNLKELAIVLSGDDVIKFQQCPKIPNNEFQNDHKEGYTAAEILQKWKLGDKPHRVRILKDISDTTGIPQTWVNETLLLCGMMTGMVKNKMSCIQKTYEIPDNMKMTVQHYDRVGFAPVTNTPLDEIALNPPENGCRLTVVVEKPIDTVLRHKREIGNNSEIDVHKILRTNKVMLESKKGHNYAVKTTYKGTFERIPKRFVTGRDLASYHKQQGSPRDACYRICNTDLTSAQGTGLSNPNSGDKIQKIEITNHPSGKHKHVKVIKCERASDSDPRPNIAYYPMEARGHFEKIENLDIMTINDIANLPHDIEIKVHEKDKSLAYDPLELCSSLCVKANFTELTAIVSILNFNGDITHPDAFELPTRRDVISAKKRKDNSSKTSLEHIHVIYLPLVDRITKKHAHNLQINEAQRIRPIIPRGPETGRRGSRFPTPDEHFKLTQLRRISTPNLFQSTPNIHQSSRLSYHSESGYRALPPELQEEIHEFEWRSLSNPSGLNLVGRDAIPPPLPPRPGRPEKAPRVPPRTTSSDQRSENVYVFHEMGSSRERSISENYYQRPTNSGHTASR